DPPRLVCDQPLVQEQDRPSTGSGQSVDEMKDPASRAGFVAVIGAPNAGKSTLVNALVGQKVAIVSAKAQTTRARLMGIAIGKADEYEDKIILAGRPGIFAPRRR